LNDRHGFFVQQFISREKAKAAAATLPPHRVIIPHVVGNEILIGVPALISDWCVCVRVRTASFVRTAAPFSLSSLFIKEIFHPRTPTRN